VLIAAHLTAGILLGQELLLVNNRIIDIQTNTPAFWLGAGGFLVRFGRREGSPAQGIRRRLTLSD